jgi:sugar-specific transcriptional regulator TrmB
MSNILQLIPSEALIYKTLIDGKIIRDVAEEAGIPYSSALMIVTRLIKFGVVTKTGHKKNFTCTAIEVPYEIVRNRNKPISAYDPKQDALIVKSLV